MCFFWHIMTNSSGQSWSILKIKCVVLDCYILYLDSDTALVQAVHVSVPCWKVLKLLPPLSVCVAVERELTVSVSGHLVLGGNSYSRLWLKVSAAANGSNYIFKHCYSASKLSEQYRLLLQKKSDIFSKQSLSPWEGASDRCDKNGGGQNLKKDQWLVECSQLMFKSANQIYGMKFKKIFNDSIRRKWKKINNRVNILLQNPLLIL